MKALICAESPPIHTTSLSSWKARSRALQRRNWEVQAQAKGFSGAAARIQKEKVAHLETVSINKERVSGKTNGTNAGADDGDEKIPNVVFERMIGRILFHVGAPLATGVAFLKVFDLMKEKQLWEVPLWLPFFTTFLTFGASALGIAFGTLSTSWDPEKKGSLLGFEEAQRNWVEIWKEEDGSKS
ncbi:hypothetical protein NMG60_11022232 [Bertholletia excelsa]